MRTKFKKAKDKEKKKLQPTLNRANQQMGVWTEYSLAIEKLAGKHIPVKVYIPYGGHRILIAKTPSVPDP
ncbi:MAG: hypothetical protein AAF939_19390 [Planctomycetota bacterium]